jgi:hypothetical protein
MWLNLNETKFYLPLKSLDFDPDSKLDPDPHLPLRLDPDPHIANADPKLWATAYETTPDRPIL